MANARRSFPILERCERPAVRASNLATSYPGRFLHGPEENSGLAGCKRRGENSGSAIKSHHKKRIPAPLSAVSSTGRMVAMAEMIVAHPSTHHRRRHRRPYLDRRCRHTHHAECRKSGGSGKVVLSSGSGPCECKSLGSRSNSHHGSGV